MYSITQTKGVFLRVLPRPTAPTGLRYLSFVLSLTHAATAVVHAWEEILARKPYVDLPRKGLLCVSAYD